MKNKLIALVEVLMVVSLLCTGYSSWAITPPDTDVQSGSMITYDVALRNLTTFGLSLSQTGANDNDKAQTFSYCTVTTGSDSTDTSTETSESGTTETTQPTSNSVTQYTNTTLSMFIKVDQTKLATWAANDYRNEKLVITCSTSETGFTMSMIDQNYLGLTQVKLTLVGYPNLYLTVGYSLAKQSLTMEIPLEQIYNLVILDKANASTKVSTLELRASFSEEGDSKTPNNETRDIANDFYSRKEMNDKNHEETGVNYREFICGLTYTFTAKLEKNQSAS